MRIAMLGVAVLGAFVFLGDGPIGPITGAVDPDTQTTCHGTRCVGSYCNHNGDSYDCWKESVYRRKAGEEVHWVCTRKGHHCSWIRGPVPGPQDQWNVIELEP